MTFAFCLFGTVAFALGPALKLSRNSVIGDLKEHAGEDVVRRRWRFLPRNPLVVVQIAFSLALLTAAALFIRGANKAASLDTGLRVENDLLLEVDASLGGFESAARGAALSHAERSARRVARRAARQHLGDGARSEWSRSAERCNAPACIVGKDEKPGDRRGRSRLQFALQQRRRGLLRHRWECRFCAAALSPWRKRCSQPARPVAIIDEALAKKLWPDGDALGQRIQIASDDAPRAKRDDGGGGHGNSPARQGQHQTRRTDRSGRHRGYHAER